MNEAPVPYSVKPPLLDGDDVEDYCIVNNVSGPEAEMHRALREIIGLELGGFVPQDGGKELSKRLESRGFVASPLEVESVIWRWKKEKANGN